MVLLFANEIDFKPTLLYRVMSSASSLDSAEGLQVPLCGQLWPQPSPTLASGAPELRPSSTFAARMPRRPSVHLFSGSLAPT